MFFKFTPKFGKVFFSIVFIIICCIVQIIECRKDTAVFSFPEFEYKETSKNELSYREHENSCEGSSRCENLIGVGKIRCIRQCISPSCYQDVYQFDELEEGEIDVRLNSFKGCFIQRTLKNIKV